MKKRYKEPEVEFIKYSFEDRLYTSPGGSGGSSSGSDDLPFVPVNPSGNTIG